MNRLILWVIGLALAFLGIYYVSSSFSFGIFDFLVVKNITCSTQYGPCSMEDYRLLEKFQGKNLFFLKSEDVVSSLLTNFKNNSASVTKIFPSTLSARLEKRKARAVIVEDLGSKKGFLVSSQGYVLSFVEQTPLPSLKYSLFRKLAVGKRVDSKLQNAVVLLYLTSKITEIKYGDVEDDNLRVILSNKSKVYYPLDRDPQILVGALQLIAYRSKMEGKYPKVIDLRYKNAILKY